MSAERDKLIDGKAVAEAIYADVAAGSAEFATGRRPPYLAVVIVGEDPASQATRRAR